MGRPPRTRPRSRTQTRTLRAGPRHGGRRPRPAPSSGTSAVAAGSLIDRRKAAHAWTGFAAGGERAARTCEPSSATSTGRRKRPRVSNRCAPRRRSSTHAPPLDRLLPRNPPHQHLPKRGMIGTVPAWVAPALRSRPALPCADVAADRKHGRGPHRTGSSVRALGRMGRQSSGGPRRILEVQARFCPYSVPSWR